MFDDVVEVWIKSGSFRKEGGPMWGPIYIQILWNGLQLVGKAKAERERNPNRSCTLNIVFTSSLEFIKQTFVFKLS